jgi:hypothetical protein
MRWHCRAECNWLGLAASGRVAGFAPWTRHGPRRRQGPNSRLPGAYLVPEFETGRQIADIPRAPGLISENRGGAAGSAPPTHAATGHRTYQKVDGSSLKLYVVRVFHVRSRPAVNRISKNRLFGGLRGRKGRETSGLDMFRRNKTTAGGRGVRIRV